MISKQSEAIHLIVTLNITPGKELDWYKTVTFDATESRKEPGCIRYDAMRDKQNDRKWYLYVIYRDQQARDDHKKNKNYEAFHAF